MVRAALLAPPLAHAPNHTPHTPSPESHTHAKQHSRAMALLYAAQLPFYVASVGMILTWEVRRRDFAAMLAHHVITASLIAASAHYRY